MTTDVFAERNTKPATTIERRNARFIGYGLIIVASLLSGFKVNVEAATRQELNDKLTLLLQFQANLATTASGELAQTTEVLNALSFASSKPLSITAGVGAGLPNATIDLPVHFRVDSGTRTVASLQFDVLPSSGLTVLSVTPGIAALAAGKQTTGAVIPGGFRVLVFGLNQTVIPTGPIAILRVRIAANASLGKRALPLQGLSASNPAGNPVPVTGKAGSITVR